MKINKLKINSYGKLKEKEIDLKDGINIIYGKNEAGKSTLLNFIVDSVYGISKNKNGKEYSNYERYMPWSGEDFSGRIEYELDNGNKYEVFRDFKKKNPKIFNENKEDISKEFNIDKTKGNEFFYEQTKVDEELFLSTLVVGQQEVKLGNKEQSMLVQKLANLVGTGEDNVSYKRAVDRINRRQLDEIGTTKSREKPINIIERNINNLEAEKQNLNKYQDFKYEIEENKNNLKEEIKELVNENNFVKEMKTLEEKEKIEKEKINIQENIKNENIEKINSLKQKRNNIEKNNSHILANGVDNEKSTKKIEREKKNLNKKALILSILVILINVLQFVFIKNGIINYIILLTIPAVLVYYFVQKNKLNKKIERENKENEKKQELINNINLEINGLQQQVEILNNNNLEIDNKLQSLRNNLNLKIGLEKEKIKNQYLNIIDSYKLDELLNFENIDFKLRNLQEELNNKNIELHNLELDQKNIEPKLDNLSKIEEELVNDKEKMLTLQRNNLSFVLAKQVLENAYINMKNSVTPKFTEELSKNISNITNGKYNNIRFNDEEGLIVEIENGDYIPASKLSVGTIDQLYLSLRLSMIEDLSKESMPIILDETFAYFDDERLENVLKYINDKFKNHQVILLTCTKREKDILDKNLILYNNCEL